MDNIRTTIGDFRKKVLDKKNTIADEVFLVSEAARHYIENMAEAVTKQFNSKIHVSLKWENPDGPIAYASERSELHINVNNPFVTERDDRAMKLVIMKALCLHECGHLLFTDYHLLNSTRKVFTDNRKLFPAPKCPEYDEWQTDAAIMTPEQIERWFKIWRRIENSVEDGFIEWMILNIIPGDGKCLLSLREIQKANDTSVKQQRQNGLETRQILFNLLLMLSKYGSVKMDPDDKDNPAIAELLKDYDLIQKATREQRSYDRVKLINELFCKLYKFFKEEKKKEEQEKEQSESKQNDNSSQDQNQNDNSKDNQNDNSSDSQDQNDSSNDDSQQGAQDNNSGAERNEGQPNDSSDSGSSNNKPSTDCGTEGSGNTSDKGNTQGGSSSIPDPFDIDIPDESLNDNIDTGSGSVLNDNNINKDFNDNQQARNNAQRLDQMMKDDSGADDAQIPTPEDKRKAESIAEQIAEDEVKKDAEKELADQLKKEASETDYSGFNKGATPNLTREEPTEASYRQYDEDYAAIKNDVKKLVNEIKNKIKDRQNGGKINALYQGRYLDNHSLYRFDQRVLCKNDLPEDIPNMALSLVVDASGSMHRDAKMTYARRTALLLYLFGRELNIPVMVYSHNANSHDCDMHALADFGSVDGKDKYRICDYTPNGCNRDGMALRFCSKKLSERPEETKICFVISDGLPSAYDSKEQAYGDIKDTLMEYSKKGVKYIACGLGDDAAKIKDIYQQGLSPKVKAEFLDCSDPSKLPVGVVRAIKELIK